MDYATYITRRPPSPPPLSPSAPPPLLSATPTPPPSEPLALHPPSSLINSRAIAEEYALLCQKVRASNTVIALRDRHESVRIRLEDLLLHSDARGRRILEIALAKCNGKLEEIKHSVRDLDEMQSRMRVIESKHFLGLRAAQNDQQITQVRKLIIQRDAVLVLVEHIGCALHDQIRIHHMLSVVAAKINTLRNCLSDMDRADRPHPQMDVEKSTLTHATAVTDTALHASGRRPFSRRTSRSMSRGTDPLTPSSVPDRPPMRSSALRPQRSLPRRSDSKLIPFVVKRALSYNASRAEEKHTHPPSAGDIGSWWGDSSLSNLERSEPKLNRAQAKDHKWRVNEGSLRDVTGGHELGHIFSLKEASIDDGGEEDFPPVSPVSHYTTSEESGRTSSRGRGSRADSAFDRNVLVDLDSLCTEASCVLSSGKIIEDESPIRRGSVPTVGFSKSGLGRMRFRRLRGSSNVKKLWMEVNELYGVILTHGPHLVEEKIVTRASVSQGILGAWCGKGGGKAGSFRQGLQAAAVGEAVRKIEAVVKWQQRLVIGIRRDFREQRRVLRHADWVISQEFVGGLEKMSRGVS